MDRGFAIIAALVTLAGAILGNWVPFMGLWYTSVSFTDFPTWFSLLGPSAVQADLAQWLAQAYLTLQVVSALLIASSIVIFLGGIIKHRRAIEAGALIGMISLVILVIGVPTFLMQLGNLNLGFRFDGTSLISTDATPNLPVVGYTQFLGGGFYLALAGTILCFVGYAYLQRCSVETLVCIDNLDELEEEMEITV